MLQGIDIQKAATNLIQKDSDGETRFDTLSGNFAMDRGTQRITHLKVVSGAQALVYRQYGLQGWTSTLAMACAT